MKKMIHQAWINTEKNSLYLYFGLKKIQFGKLGNNVRINASECVFGNSHHIYIDDDVFIGRGVYMDAASEIHIMSGCMIGPRCVFIGGSHNYNSSDLQSVPFDRVMNDRPILFEKNVQIGANVTVCPGCHIGEGAVIGAGTCIYGDIPAFSVVVGSSYRIIKQRDLSQYSDLVNADAIYNKLFVGQPFILRK